MSTRVLMLYRPRLPGQRAQTLQVLHMAHALARGGASVTVLADRAEPGATAETALGQLGLTSVPGLMLELAPMGHKGVAGAWFRWRAWRWSQGPPGVVFARDLRRLVGLSALCSGRHRVVLEVHGRPSGDALPAADALAMERRALACAHAVVANCEGTASEWEDIHHAALPGPVVVAHNGTAADRVRGPVSGDGVVRAVGSLRPYKGWETLVRAAALDGVGPVEVVGGQAAELATSIPPSLRVSDPVRFPLVPDLLARSAALVLPLADNRFGRVLTSPLKLFDYLASSVPLVLPELPTVDRALAAAKAPTTGIVRYDPHNPRSLARAIVAARSLGPRPSVLRSWQQRQDELRTVLFPEGPSATD